MIWIILACLASFGAGVAAWAIWIDRRDRRRPVRVVSRISEFGPHFADVPSDCSGYSVIEVNGEEVWRSRKAHYPMKFTEREAWDEIARRVTIFNPAVLPEWDMWWDEMTCTDDRSEIDGNNAIIFASWRLADAITGQPIYADQDAAPCDATLYSDSHSCALPAGHSGGHESANGAVAWDEGAA